MPRLRREMRDVLNECDTAPGECDRSQIRRRKLRALIAERHIRTLDLYASGDASRRFEERVVPFLRVDASITKGNDESKSAFRTRGAKRQRPGTISEWTSTSQSSADGSIIREFQAEFRGVGHLNKTEVGDTCCVCGGPVLIVEQKASLCCSVCGISKPFIDMTVVQSLQRGDVEFVSQSYKRANHFLEWLNSIQAKSSFVVPDDVIAQIIRHLVQSGVRAASGVTCENVRQALKNLRLRAYYEHVCQIACRISGGAPPRFRPEIEERLRLMFLAVQQPFERARGLRKNFLSYSYILMQFLWLLGIDIDSVPRLAFTMLKGPDKLEKQNAIYREICRELDWSFRPLSH